MICFAFSMVEMISELLVGDCVTVVGFGIGEGRGECSFCFTVALLELGVSFAWRAGKIK